MATAVNLLAAALVYCFILCCALSGILQVLAWSRHAQEGAPVTLRALREPDGYFDSIGVRQVLLSRRLLLVGGVAYLTYGVLIVLATVF
jgi:hypothetical protein